jgi:site-specific DNA recombinase
MAQPRLRCAIYTRKSSEEGLEQGFNSLHAQREACEAYVLSQAGEGWIALPTIYDDGGFSGGSMERPGLKTLLRDIDRGVIDVVVVYKVDRLTRSLGDFARIVEAFDAKSVSFVSVTQAFNTTTSMGRLTLNVLLSFAQFEREVTGERIRDKIRASKVKGMWMGGVPPLGYDGPTDPNHRALAVNAAEAQTVRLIFAQYLELGSVHAVVRWLGENSVASKSWTTLKGRAMGGLTFNRGALYHLLRNRTYLGQIPHRDLSHPGLHPAIVDRAVFDEVQTRLNAQMTHRKVKSTSVATMVLKGMIFDADGHPMSPSFGQGRRGQTYRYYVSSPLLKGDGGLGRETPRRAPAVLIEPLVRICLQRLSADASELTHERVKALVSRVEVHRSSLQVVLTRSRLFKRASDPETEVETLCSRLEAAQRLQPEAGEPTMVRVTIPCRFATHRGRAKIMNAAGSGVARTAPDPALIRALRTTHQRLATECGSPIGRVEQLTLNIVPVSRYERLLYRLAFLAPDLQAMILEGLQPAELNLDRILERDLPVSWQDQRRMFQIPC